MKKIVALLLALILILISVCAAAEEMTVVDSVGTAFTFTETPKNVAVLFSSFAEIWNLAGGEVAITVGESIERGFADEEALLVDESAGKSINLDLLVSYKPDLVICSADIPAQVEAAQMLNGVGIPAMQFCVESFDDYLFALKTMTTITGNTDAYETYGEAVQAEIDELLSSIEKIDQTMLFIRAGSSDKSTKAKTGEEHFACAMLEEMGLENIAAKAPLLLDTLSLETILIEDPDYIFFSMMGDEEAAKAHIDEMLESEAWAALTAVKEGRVFILPKDLFHFKPNARWAEAWRYLIDAVCGEVK